MGPTCCRCECEYDACDLEECEACGELVCFDCSKHASGPHECIDYSICAECYESRQDDLWDAESKVADARKAKSVKARARYHSPEARAKRAAAKKVRDAEKARQESERRKQLREELATTMAMFSRFF